MKHEFFWIDAFTDRKFGGNPCAVVFVADSLTDDQMLTIAKEFNLSETAFVVASSQADFGARYFTPAEEIPLAGHPTIATIRALIEAGRVVLDRPQVSLSLELKAGIVGIDIVRDRQNTELIVMSQKKPVFLSVHEHRTVAEIFGLKEVDMMTDFPIQTVSTGTPQLMVPVRNLEALKRASLRIESYVSYKSTSDFFSPHLFCLQGVTPDGSTFARHFGVPPDTAEDAFTGSATGGMAAYLWHYGLLNRPKFTAEQGHWMGRPGSARVEIVGPPENIETVRVGGKGVVLARGEIDL